MGQESACDAGDTGDVGLIPGLGTAPGEENGNPFQYYLLGNPMVGGAWSMRLQRVRNDLATEHAHIHTWLVGS